MSCELQPHWMILYELTPLHLEASFRTVFRMFTFWMNSQTLQSLLNEVRNDLRFEHNFEVSNRTRTHKFCTIGELF